MIAAGACWATAVVRKRPEGVWGKPQGSPNPKNKVGTTAVGRKRPEGVWGKPQGSPQYKNQETA